MKSQRYLRIAAQRVIFRLSAFLLWPVLAFGSATVTGHVSNPGLSVASGSNYWSFELQGCGNNPARATQGGEAGTLTNYKRVNIDGSGNSSDVIVRNDQISCGGQTTSTFYLVTLWINNSAVPGTAQKYRITSPSFDLNSATPITVNPVVVAPTGDSTYGRLDGANTPFIGAIQFSALNNIMSARVTSVGTGLQIPSTLSLNLDAVKGGVNDILTTKTQFQPLRFSITGRTIGERKGIQGFADCYAKGDCLGVYGLAFDSGGYLTGGDEGTHGLDGWAIQGSEDSYTTDGGFPRGTVTAINGDVVTVSWTSGTNAHLGDHRPLIITNRGVYNTGTVSGVDTTAPYNGNICHISGAGTSWFSVHAQGGVSTYFLNITGNDNGTVKHVVPIVYVATNTDLLCEYNLAELGATSFSSSMVKTGAYNIYQGSTIASLVDAGAGADPVSVTVGTGEGSIFQVGDSVQVPLGYNFHGLAVQAVVSRLIGEPQGGGFYIHNVGTKEFRDAYRASGNFQRGILFDSGTLSGNGVEFAEPVGGSLLRQTDLTAATQQVISILNGSSIQRTLTYDRTNDWWQWSGGQYFSGTDARFGFGTNPQANVLGYFFYNNAAWTGFNIAPAVAPNAGVPILEMAVAGATRFRQENLITQFANGDVLKGWSNQFLNQTWGIDSSNGSSSFAGNMQVGAAQTATGVGLLVKGGDTGAQVIAATPKVGSGAYVILSNDSSGNPQLGTTAAGGFDHVPETDFIIQSLATTHAAAIKVNGLEGIRVQPTGIAQFANGAQVNTTTTKPTCASGVRGLMWLTPGGAGVKDAFEICAKDGADAYAWRTIY